MVGMVAGRRDWQCRAAMPVYWKIDSRRKLVTIVAEGDVTRAEIDSFLDVMDGVDCHDYRKLFAGAASETRMLPDDMLALGVRMRAMHKDRHALGALAIVVPDDKIELVSRVLGMLAVAERPMRVFSTLPLAEDWIERQSRA